MKQIYKHIKLARPYAQALFKWSLKYNQTEECLAFIQTAAAVLEEPAMRFVLTHPKIGARASAELLIKLTKKTPVDPMLSYFLYLIAKRERILILPDIAYLFQFFHDTQNRVMDACVQTAFPLTDEEEGNLMKTLQKRYPNRRLNLSYETQPSLIGGFVIRMDDMAVDASVQQHLKTIRQTLKHKISK